MLCIKVVQNRRPNNACTSIVMANLQISNKLAAKQWAIYHIFHEAIQQCGQISLFEVPMSMVQHNRRAVGKMNGWTLFWRCWRCNDTWREADFSGRESFTRHELLFLHSL